MATNTEYYVEFNTNSIDLPIMIKDGGKNILMAHSNGKSIEADAAMLNWADEIYCCYPQQTAIRNPKIARKIQLQHINTPVTYVANGSTLVIWK